MAFTTLVAAGCRCGVDVCGFGVDMIISSHNRHDDHQLQLSVLLHLITFAHSGHISEAPGVPEQRLPRDHMVGTGHWAGARRMQPQLEGRTKPDPLVRRSYEKDLSLISASCGGGRGLWREATCCSQS